MTNPNALSSASPSRQLQNRGPADDVATEPKAVHQAIALAIEFLSIALLTSVMVSMTTARTQGRKLKLIGPDRKSTRLNSSHRNTSRMPSSA